VKDITTVRYPASRKGQIRFNVAGETISPLYQHYQKQQPGLKKQALTISNGFTIPYVDRIDVLDELIDTIFYERPGRQAIEQMMERPVDTSHEAVYSSRPALANYLFGAALPVLLLEGLFLGTVYFVHDMVKDAMPLVPFAGVLALNVLLVAAGVAYLRSISYRIQSYRVLKRSGLLFRKQTSITFNHIDFININQDAMNKMFGNGNVTVNTVGSSKTELSIDCLKDFRRFYDMLKKHYK
jgi:membrane protein YdbS with pleckstrin-like domain